MRVICIQDGINDFGQSPSEFVKKGDIYHILHSMPSGSLGVPPQNPHKGDWYHCIERAGWHWHGLFEPLGWDEELEEEVQKEYSQLN